MKREELQVGQIVRVSINNSEYKVLLINTETDLKLVTVVSELLLLFNSWHVGLSVIHLS